MQKLARDAGPGGTLAAAERPAVETIPLQETSHPSAWQWAGYPRSLLPVTAGTIRAKVRVPHAGRYEVWLGGSVRPEVDLTVDGRPVGQVRHQLNNEGEYVLLGRARLGVGTPRAGDPLSWRRPPSGKRRNPEPRSGPSSSPRATPLRRA